MPAEREPVYAFRAHTGDFWTVMFAIPEGFEETEERPYEGGRGEFPRERFGDLPLLRYDRAGHDQFWAWYYDTTFFVVEGAAHPMFDGGRERITLRDFLVRAVAAGIPVERGESAA